MSADASRAGLACRRLVAWGRVQGVFYRASCAAEARRLGVAGWVANRADGSVEALIEGDAEQVETLVDWCRHGPTTSQVDALTVVDEEPHGLVGFTVR